MMPWLTPSSVPPKTASCIHGVGDKKRMDYISHDDEVGHSPRPVLWTCSGSSSPVVAYAVNEFLKIVATRLRGHQDE